MNSPARVVVKDGACWLVLDGRHPEGISPAAMELMASTLERESRAGVRVLVVTCDGPNFAFGRRLLPRDAPLRDDVADRRAAIAAVQSVYDAVFSAPVPVVAAVRGEVAGLGWAIAASCDVMIASDDSRFVLPEIDAGFPPLIALASILQHGYRQSILASTLAGDPVTADEAFRVGAAAMVVPPGELLHEAERFAMKISQRPSRAISEVIRFARTIRSGETISARDAAERMLVDALANKLICGEPDEGESLRKGRS